MNYFVFQLIYGNLDKRTEFHNPTGLQKAQQGTLFLESELGSHSVVFST